MSRTQRLVFLIIALVIAVIAVVLITTLSTSGGDEAEVTATPTPTPTATATAESPAATKTPSAAPKPQPPLVTGEGIKKLQFKEGDTIRFRVRADVTDEVHVHGYDLMKDITPGETVTFSFPATITGIFEVEFEDAGKQIAQLRVDPD
jgi:heme/copper-type cytochrome/quinol oxidase subunit 2